jgi:hypothetical protein
MPVEVDVNDVNVTGTFDVLVEYQGEGYARVNNIEIIEGTTIADVPDDTEPDAPSQDNEPEEPKEELENIIERKTFTQEDGATTTITTIEFDARKSNSRTSGTLTVAIVQGDEVLGTDTFRVRDMKSTFNTMEASFDSIEVEGDFDVAIMYNGDSWVYVDSISVPNATEPEGDLTN